MALNWKPFGDPVPRSIAAEGRKADYAIHFLAGRHWAMTLGLREDETMIFDRQTEAMRWCEKRDSSRAE